MDRENSMIEFTLLGRPLRARIHTPALRLWLAEHWRYDEHDPPPHPYRIDLDESDRLPDDLRGPGALAGTNGNALPHPDQPLKDRDADGGRGGGIEAQLPEQTLRWWKWDSWWWTGGAESGVAARFDAAGAEIRVWGAATPMPDTYLALYLAMNEALRASGLVPLHAAVVVRGQDAVALVAPSGTGKTTTLLRLLAAGWAPLAEDLSWLDPESLAIYGWDRGIRLWPHTIEQFLPHLAGAPWSTDSDGKLFLDYQALAEIRVPRATLTRIVLLERERDRAEQLPWRLSPLPPHEAVRTIWEATGVPLPAATRTVLAQRIPTLLTRVTCARLRLGSGAAPPIDL